eukprot:768-Eustigmatos_ZCMA.PRE.1
MPSGPAGRDSVRSPPWQAAGFAQRTWPRRPSPAWSPVAAARVPSMASPRLASPADGACEW